MLIGLVVWVGWFVAAESLDGDWRKKYPPWGEEESATYGSPQVFVPILGPFTRHSCYPSRYMSQRIATSHINRRDPTFCPSIGELQNHFELTYDIFDSNANGIAAVDALLSARLDLRNRSKVILGPNGSPASLVIAPVLSVFGIPQVSWAATSGELSNKDVYPYFSRVAVSDALTVAQLADFVLLYVGYKVNLLASDDSYASGQVANFRDGADANMTLTSFTFPSSGAGGASISDSNLVTLLSKLSEIRATNVRVVFVGGTQQEAFDVLEAAYTEQMVKRAGWVWLGADGFNAAPFGSDVAQMAIFSGMVYVISYSQGPLFDSYSAKWAEDMPSTETPEFFEMPICNGNVICDTHPDFNNFNTSGQREALICTGYTAFAYDSVMFIAKVIDLIMGDPASPKSPSTFTADDWSTGFRMMANASNAMSCLSGEFVLNENQDRVSGLVFRNLQAGTLVHEDLLLWSPTSGYDWIIGAKMVWPSGVNFTIEESTVQYMPSGAPPQCLSGEELIEDVCEACTPGRVSVGGEGAVCDSCREGTYQSEIGASSCIECSPGRFANEEQTSACLLCPPGTSTSGLKALPSCFECSPGKYQPLEGEALCEDCDIGMYSVIGATGCLNCTAGTSTENRRGEGVCSPCSPGYFAAEEQSWSCDECPAGRYAEESSSTACTQCSILSGWSTLIAVVVDSSADEDDEALSVWVPYAGSSTRSSCGCKSGTRPVGLECVPCGEGLECAGFGEVLVSQGYFSSEAISIFKCVGPDATQRCHGGLPGATCAEGRGGITCSECFNGFTPAAEGLCKECSGTDYLPFLCSCVIVVILLSMLYKVVSGQSRMKTDHASLLLVIVCGQVATMAQQLTVVSMIELSWTEPMSSLFSLVEVIGFRLDYIRVSCWAVNDVVQRYVYTLCLTLILLFLMFVIHIVNTILFYHGQFRQRQTKLIGCVGTVVFAFYISIVSTVLVPLQCFEHPNGKKTVIAYASVLCDYTGSHRNMLAYGMPFLLLPIGFYVWCAWLVVRFPAKILAQDGNFMNTHAFLFSRFQTRAYFYPMVMLTRSLLVACAPVLSNSAGQVLMLEYITIVVLVSLTMIRPWRVLLAHYIDIFITCGVLMALCVSSFLIVEQVDEEVLSWGAFMLLVFAACAALAGISHAYMARVQKALKRYQFFLSHHKAAAGCFVRLLKIHLLEHPKVTRQVFVDADDLENLDTLFETIRSQVETIVAVATKELLCRPWCVGELVTAHVNQVTTVPLFYADFEMPTDTFISAVDTMVDMEPLVQNGIDVEAVKEMMFWVLKWEGLGCQLPDSMHPRLWVELSKQLAAKTSSFKVDPKLVDREPTWAYDTPRIFVMSDLSGEALATAYILNKMLSKLSLGDAEVAPALMPTKMDDDPDFSLPDSVRHGVVVCTNGCLSNDYYLVWLATFFSKQVHLQPVLGEEGFRFPSKQASFTLSSPWSASTGTSRAAIAALVQPAVIALFKAIAIHFIPLGPEKVLWERAQDIAIRAKMRSRLIGGTGKIGDLYMPPSDVPPSETPSVAGGTPDSPPSPRTPVAVPAEHVTDTDQAWLTHSELHVGQAVPDPDGNEEIWELET